MSFGTHRVYAQQQIVKMPRPITKHACSEEWKPVTVIEMKKFLGLIFVTGIVPKPKLELYRSMRGDRGGTLVKVLCYKSEGRWFDPRRCHWKFSLT